jgi:Family of unknown function (DUF6521)
MPNKTKWDLRWSDRPAEEARNLNPAFCGELIFRAVSEYFRTKRSRLWQTDGTLAGTFELLVGDFSAYH